MISKFLLFIQEERCLRALLTIFIFPNVEHHISVIEDSLTQLMQSSANLIESQPKICAQTLHANFYIWSSFPNKIKLKIFDSKLDNK